MLQAQVGLGRGAATLGNKELTSVGRLACGKSLAINALLRLSNERRVRRDRRGNVKYKACNLTLGDEIRSGGSWGCYYVVVALQLPSAV